jgi:hypothetical protein
MRPNHPHRYVPTLTEVVAPAPLHTAGLDAAVLTAEVLKTVRPLVEQELQKVVQSHMEAQVSSLLAGLHQQIELAVRVAIEQHLAQNILAISTDIRGPRQIQGKDGLE